ncbi:MAG TPA: carbamate kinase [Thermoplasmata archaeon]|nr:carbamate kinase [Thermoplasmata archaeon]
MNEKIMVLAIGGNSLIKDKSHQSVPDQFKTTRKTCEKIREVVERGWKITLTHGNGPQVGFILLRSELASSVLHPVPLDSCGADTQGAIGYMLQQGLYNSFKKAGLKREAVTVVTQAIVDKHDPAFGNPTKPIGPFYTKEQARKLREERRWEIVEDAGRGWRRIVPSPKPISIVESTVIKNLLDLGYIVISTGGGGIPVIEENGMLKGVEAVIDKDFGSSLLAQSIGARVFLISTSIDRVYLDFGRSTQRAIDRMDVKQAEKYLKEGHFREGSMKPKIRAGIEFLNNGGQEVIITSPDKILSALDEKAGTRIVKT